MKTIIAPLLFILLAWGCGKDRREMIVGKWKVDSIYTYYNGYGTMDGDSLDLEQYSYEENGDMKVSWLGSTKQMMYTLKGRDSLLYFENGLEASRYVIVGLNSKQLVLKKTKQPLFNGNGQERYEVRYFSRVEK